MHRSMVISSFAKSIGFELVDNEKYGILEIETHGNPRTGTLGHIYQLKNITPRRFAEFVKAKSIGKYYNRYLKENTRYECSEIFEQHMTDEVDTVQEIAEAVVTELLGRFSLRV